MNHITPKGIRFVILAAALLVACAGLAAAGSEPEPVEPETTETVSSDMEGPSWKQDTSPFTFDMFFYASWGAPYKWGDDYVSNLIESKTGVRPNVFVPTGNDNEYLNILIASEDLPDVMVLQSGHPVIRRLIENDLVYSINELSEMYAPGLLPSIHQEIVEFFKYDDGQLYTLPSFFYTARAWEETPDKSNMRPFFVREDIYEAIGSPPMETPAQVISALSTVKDRYPDIEPFGVEPFGATEAGFFSSLPVRYLVSCFGPETMMGVFEGDRLLLPIRTEGYRKAIAFLNELYREDLLSAELFTMQSEQYDQNLVQGRYFYAAKYLPAIFATINPQISANNGDDSRAYAMTDILRVDGQDPVFVGTRGSAFTELLVTKSAENPARTAAFLEYAWSEEGQMDNEYGILGDTYQIVDGLPTFSETYMEEQAAGVDVWSKYAFSGRTLVWRPEYLVAKEVTSTPAEQLAAWNELNQYAADGYPLGLTNIDPESTSPEGVTLARILAYWEQVLPQLVLAESVSEFNSTFDAALDEVARLGADEVEAVRYKRHLADLAKKGLAN